VKQHAEKLIDCQLCFGNCGDNGQHRFDRTPDCQPEKEPLSHSPIKESISGAAG
jgi:hypothetical protein